MSYADALKELTARELKAFKLDLEEYAKLASDKKLSQKYKKLPDKASIRARLTRSEEVYIRSIHYVEELAKKTNTSLEKLLPDIYIRTTCIKLHMKPSECAGSLKRSHRWMIKLPIL